MKKILGMILVIPIFHLFATFFPTVTFVPLHFATGLVQTYAEETTNIDISSIKGELKEERELLVGLKDELEFIAEREKETQEAIDYLKTQIKDLENDLQQGNKSEENPQEKLYSAKEELKTEITLLEEIRDELEAFKELKEETEDRIAKLSAKILKAGSLTVSAGTETSQQTPVDTSGLSTVSAGESKPTKEELQEQLRLTKEALEKEIVILDDIEEETELLQEEMQEVEMEREDTEAVIKALLTRIQGLETAIASIEAKEETPSSVETKSSDASSTKE